MSTTEKYNFMFLIPKSLTTVPIPFQQFEKIDENGNQVGFYTYDEYMELPGNKAIYTPSNTHAMMSINVTSIFQLATLFPNYVASVDSTIEIHEGIETDKWQDADQTNYLWIVTTDPKAAGYTWVDFKAQSPLFQKP